MQNIQGRALPPRGGDNDNNTRTPKRRRRSERGAGLVEYALIIALISAMTITGARAVGDSNQTTFTDVADSLGGATACETWQASFDDHAQARAELQANRQWSGRRNRSRRSAWNTTNAELIAEQATLGC